MKNTILLILEGDFDVLVDTKDTLGMKLLLLQAACDNRIRTFSSMGVVLYFDATAIGVSHLKNPWPCPIASRMRRGLWHMDTSNITCTSSEEHPFKVRGDLDEHGRPYLVLSPLCLSIRNDQDHLVVRGRPWKS